MIFSFAFGNLALIHSVVCRYKLSTMSAVYQPEEVYDVVGPMCESSDVFVKSESLDRCRRGDFIAIRSAGAYGESMAFLL